MSTHVFSTSSAKAYLDCPRKRWLQYEAPNGTATHGLERVRMDVAPWTGIFTHQGIADLLKGVDIEKAVVDAMSAYRVEAGLRGLALESGGNAAYVIAEQTALIEGLLRGFNLVVLPRIFADYEVLFVEQEEIVQMTPSLTFMARADAGLRRKSDGLVFVPNWKTVGGANDFWAKRFEYDVQMISECVAVEQRLGERVAGVLVVGLDKGRRTPPSPKEREAGVEQYRQASPLIYGYKTDSNPPMGKALYAPDYTRAKGWHRFNVWDDPDGMTVKRWVEEVLPRETLEAQFVQLPPIMRQDAHVDAWRRQTIAREERIAADASACRAECGDIDTMFPQNTDACMRWGPCSMLDICWTPSVGEDPIQSGLFRPRQPHHLYEIELASKESI